MDLLPSVMDLGPSHSPNLELPSGQHSEGFGQTLVSPSSGSWDETEVSSGWVVLDESLVVLPSGDVEWGFPSPLGSRDPAQPDPAQPDPADYLGADELTAAQEERLRACEDCLGHRFANVDLLRWALTHSSGAAHRLASNERMEFLGDAILGAVVCEYLFSKYPTAREGELTKIKSAVVSRRTCAEITRQLGLGDFLIVGKGMHSHRALPQSLLANVFESVVAALYLDGGWEVAKAFVTTSLGDEIEAVAENSAGVNYKSQLQQLAQREHGSTPLYRLLAERGPDHSKAFKVSAQIGETRFSAAWGRNKKEAEQRAARNALCELSGQPAPFAADRQP